MNNSILFFLPKGALNDATEYYVEILQKGFEKAGYKVSRSDSLTDIRKFKKILTIEAKWFFFIKIINPSASIMNWFQGVVAEEAYLTTNSIFRKKLWNFFEAFTLRYSELNIFVSDKMRLYFQKNYKIKSKKYFVMPCFNKGLNLDLVDKGKYLNPSFVYAGSLAKWQCIEQTLELYSILEQKLSNATITLLTKEKEYALELIHKYKIKNFNIFYVSLNNLDSELAKYKYGFLLREDHIVNHVATPTKMNSYLSVGVIPIFSDVIFDYNKNFNDFDNIIKLNSKLCAKKWSEIILKYEDRKGVNDYDNFFNDLNEIFVNYYNRDGYIMELSKIIEIE